MIPTPEIGNELIGALVLTHLNRVELEVYAFNPTARHIYSKLGFTIEGTRRQALWWDGEPVDAIVMAILREEFDASDAPAV